MLLDCSSGLGITFVEVLGESGADLVICARRRDLLRKNAEQIAKKTKRLVYPITCDVSNEQDVKSLVEEAKDRLGRIGVLINNAGVVLVKSATEVDGKDWSEVIRTNLAGTFYCSREVAKLMISQNTRGSIINIASTAGLRAEQIPSAAYHTSKAAIVNLTRALALEWADNNIRVNAIAPGFFPSGTAEKKDHSTAWWEDEKESSARIPLKRWGSPDELKGIILLLASDAGSFITGQTFAVDGGYSAK